MRDPSCYAVMMEVIHGHGAIIRHGQLTLGITATTLAPLWDALPYLIELARILSSPVASRTLKLAQPVRLASPAG